MKCHPAWRQGGTLLWSWWSLQFRHYWVFLYCLKYPLSCRLRHFGRVALAVVVADCAIPDVISAVPFLPSSNPSWHTVFIFYLVWYLQCCSFQVYRQMIHLYIFLYFFLKKFFIDVPLIYNVVPISPVQQTDSVIHIGIYFLKYSFLLWSIPGDWIEFLRYAGGLCCSSILNVIVCIYQPQTCSPSLSLPLSPLATTSQFSMSEASFCFMIGSFVPCVTFCIYVLSLI